MDGKISERPFRVDPDLCTACGECWSNMPDNFRDNGSDVAEVYNIKVKDLKVLEQTMEDCPGAAILWK